MAGTRVAQGSVARRASGDATLPLHAAASGPGAAAGAGAGPPGVQAPGAEAEDAGALEVRALRRRVPSRDAYPSPV